jgi:signal transduction histidine kinase
MRPMPADRARVTVLLTLAGLVGAFLTWGAIAASRHAPNDNVYAPAQYAIAIVSLACAVFIGTRAPRHPIGWLLLATAAGSAATAAGTSILSNMTAPTWYVRPLLLAATAGWVLARGLLQGAVPFAYPDGIGSNPWRRVAWGSLLAVILVAAGAQALAFGTIDLGTFQPASWSARVADVLPWTFRALFVAAVLSNADLLRRVFRMPPPERRRHRAVAIAAVLLALPGIIDLAGVAGLHPPSADDLETLADLALPVLLVYGILRHQVLGFRVVVRRVAVYAMTAVILAAAYALAVVTVASIITDRTGLATILAVGVVAIAAYPVHGFVERLVRRVFYGDRDDPYRALSRLGERLATTPEGRDALEDVAASVQESLRLAHVAIDVTTDRGLDVTIAEIGAPDPDRTLAFPIAHGGVVVGRLRATPREGVRDLAPAEIDLLADLARATGPAARSVQLVTELRRSREQLVVAREEERRRLRRDLHDGLGPTLAGVALGLDAAARRLGDDAELAPLLHALGEDVQSTITNVRALVHGLRPPALDDLGLVPALRQFAANVRTRGSETAPEIAIEVPMPIPALPAAVEVAAYRIAVEGITNVVRHAAATKCTVVLDAETEFAITIDDDGTGIEAADRPGVGMASMRERAEELGGRVQVLPRPQRGTTVRAYLPLAFEAS